MSENTTITKQKETFWYKVARAAAAIAFKGVGFARYHHPERVADRKGPFILIGNHSSMLDPFAIACLIKDRPVHFMSKKELSETPIIKHILKHVYVIPVDRHNTDMEAMRASVKTLREGNILGIFPEGTRHHQGLMTELESGTAMIALRSGVPVVPAYITPKPRLFHSCDVYIGEPIPTEDLREQGINRETCAALMQRITETYAKMEKERDQ